MEPTGEAAAAAAGAAPGAEWFSGDAATFGDRLTAAREAAGMDQRTLARRMGVKLKTVEGWENDVSEPRANKLQMVAGVLNVSIRWLLTGQGDGLHEPAADAELAATARDLMGDLRQVRVEMGQLSDRLGMLEKRLRAVMKDAL
ncbi:helix-turn-helix transcriptional regulator [Rhodobacteraceae bacterium 2376]|uniref:Helix-turn-helix transcriptional regulator n=1 Tax=Rhabdonatronobacter sediminivivens TaxID=2743469 RepID=A0A7Z0HW48_9RHOB|nr:helix-turn-helix transcriptional regulator [Rhabdonatronobacter sediminivivens]NYS23460.1 helix-turn-helix transcriptional regulator [Rhabdonatronobacter sediminivivens]